MDKLYVTTFQTPSGNVGIVPDAPPPQYRDALGSGQGQWQFSLPRPVGSVGVPGDGGGQGDLVLGLTGGTLLQTYVIDDSTTTYAGGGTYWGDWTAGTNSAGDPPLGGGQLCWQGLITALNLRAGDKQDDVEINALPQQSILSTTYFTGPQAFTDVDAVQVAEWFFSNGYCGAVTWHPSNTLSGNLITQSFQDQTIRQILDFCTTAAGEKYVNHVDERNRFRLWAPDLTTATHTVMLSREVAAMNYTQTLVPAKNRIIVRGKGISPVVATAPGWTQATTRDGLYNFPEVTDASTAYLIAQSLLGQLNRVFVRAKLTLVTNAAGVLSSGTGVLVPTNNRGYVLESVRPGDTVQLWLDSGDPLAWVWGDAKAGTNYCGSGQLDIIDTPQIVQGVTYNQGDTIEIDLSTPQPAISAAHRATQRLAERALSQQVQ